MELIQFQPGTLVALNYNPDNPQQMRIRRGTDTAFPKARGVTHNRAKPKQISRPGKPLPRGVPAEGTVVGIARTGLEKKGRQEYRITVRFTTEHGERVTAHEYKFLTTLEAQRLDTGPPVTLHYDSARPHEMSIQVTDDLPGVIYSPGPVAASQQPVWSLLDPGLPNRHFTGQYDRGVILEAAQTGPVVSGLRETRLRVEVTRADGSKFETTKVRMRPPAALQLMNPGAPVDAYYVLGEEDPVIRLKPDRRKAAAYMQSLSSQPHVLRWE